MVIKMISGKKNYNTYVTEWKPKFVLTGSVVGTTLFLISRKYSTDKNKNRGTMQIIKIITFQLRKPSASNGFDSIGIFVVK